MTETSRKLYRLIAAMVAAVIVYGSLFPFAFERPPGNGSALDTLLHSWNAPPSGFGDPLANVLLYLPLGFFLMPALGQRRGWLRLIIATLLGFCLCTSMELAQYDDVGRITSMSDVYANTAGTFLGALGGLVIRTDLRWPGLGRLGAAPVPGMLLLAWFGYRFFPYVPTIDLHKYWNAVKPLVLYPSVTGYDLGRYIAVWLTVAALVAAIAGARRAMLGLAALIGCVLVGDVFIVGRELSVARTGGAAIALLLWPLLALLGTRLRHLLIALALLAAIIAERLEPFEFSATEIHAFGWIPFYSFMASGSLNVDIQSFLEKFFLYGSVVWLFARAGVRIGAAAPLIATVLLATSVAETHLPARSAEVTDALMVLMIAAIMMLMEHAARDAARGDAARCAARVIVSSSPSESRLSND